MAFNSKNLHYEKNEPAFLRKLRGEYGSDRQSFQAARPKRDRLANDDDDAPAMVDEEGATVSKEEYEAMISGKDDDVGSKTTDEKHASIVTGKEVTHGGETAELEAENAKQKVADVGVAKKRKQAKVVREETEGEDELQMKKSKPVNKAKKKVKLSFDEPDG